MCVLVWPWQSCSYAQTLGTITHRRCNWWRMVPSCGCRSTRTHFPATAVKSGAISASEMKLQCKAHMTFCKKLRKPVQVCNNMRRFSKRQKCPHPESSDNVPYLRVECGSFSLLFIRQYILGRASYFPCPPLKSTATKSNASSWIEFRCCF